MIKWPPNRAWTSKYKINGEHHFIIINYGVKEKVYWVNLVSVIDANICFILNLDELSDNSIWIPGWQDFENDMTEKDLLSIDSSCSNMKSLKKGCLHPSDDSGLSIGSDVKKIRPWFP